MRPANVLPAQLCCCRRRRRRRRERGVVTNLVDWSRKWRWKFPALPLPFGDREFDWALATPRRSCSSRVSLRLPSGPQDRTPHDESFFSPSPPSLNPTTSSCRASSSTPSPSHRSLLPPHYDSSSVLADETASEQQPGSKGHHPLIYHAYRYIGASLLV